MMLTPRTELWKGLTDLPIAAFAGVLAVLLFVHCGKNARWGRLMAMVAASALMGAAAHSLVIPEPQISLLWVVLYVLLFESVRQFCLLAVRLLCGGPAREHAAVWIAEAVLWVTAVALRFYGSDKDILAFVAFAAMLVVRMLAAMRRSRPVPQRFARMMLMLFAALAFQGFSDLIPYGVVWCHVMIILSLYAVYTVGRADDARRTGRCAG